MNPFSSGIDFTWRDQLQTPTERGASAMVAGLGVVGQVAGSIRQPTGPRSRSSLFLVERPQLVELQLGHFLRTGPDDGLAGLLGGVHQVDRLGVVVPEHLAQDQDDEHLGVVGRRSR